MAYNRTFRVFLSSTFDDFQLERDVLRRRVWPKLEEFCKLRGAAFEAIDLRWGIPANAAADVDIVQICLDEVERCRKLTPRPNFIALVGNRYGWRPLPFNIPAGVFDTLPAETKDFIHEHRYYLRDDNAVPPVYCLNRKSVPGRSRENALLTRIRRSLNSLKPTAEQEEYFFKSATHLEIDKGIFKPGAKDAGDHFFSCFRHIEEFSGPVKAADLPGMARGYIDMIERDELCLDPERAEWLKKMVDGITVKLRNHPGQIGHYHTTLDELANVPEPKYLDRMCRDLETWLKKIITGELARLDKKSPLEIECSEHETFRIDRTVSFGGRGKLRREIIDDPAVRQGGGVICIHGVGGSGKTALVSKLVDDAREHFADAVLIRRFIGATPYSVELNRLLGGIVEEVNHRLNLPRKTPGITREEHADAFAECLNAPTLNGRVFIFIDALEQLNNTENAHSLSWLAQTLSNRVTLVLSARDGAVLEAVHRIYPDAKFFDISPGSITLEPGEAGEMLNALLQKEPARILQKKQQTYILEHFNKNPLLLHLKLVAENARHWRSFDRIEDIEEKNTGIKESVDEQIQLLIDRLSQEHNHGEIFAKHVLLFIALAREGMSAAEIEDAIWMDDAYREEFNRRKQVNQPEVDGLPPIIWSRFYFEIEPFLMERMTGGTIVFDFFHRRFEEAVKERHSPETVTAVHRLLATYFSDGHRHPVSFTGEDGDIVYNDRKLTELPYHQVNAGLMDDAYVLLTDLFFIEAKARTGKTYELMEDFENAVKRDKDNGFPLLHLVAKALRADVNFIARHPGCLFQSLYNSCWWYDHPCRNDYYDKNTPVKRRAEEKPGKLYALAESWKDTKKTLEPGFRWLKALHPPAVSLDDPQESVLKGLSSPVIFARYSPGNDKIYAVCNVGEFIVWDAVSQNIEQFHRLDHERSFMFKPDSRISFNTRTETLVNDGGDLSDHPGFEYWAWPGVISVDGKFILGGDSEGTVTLWEFSSRRHEKRILKADFGHPPGKNPLKRPVRGMAISGNNRFAAIGHGDGSLTVWDLNTAKPVASLKHTAGWVNSVAMSGNGSTIVSGGGDNSLYVWERDSTQQYRLTVLTGHSDRIWCVALSHDGRVAASGSDDKSVRLWDLHTKKELKCLNGHSRWVQAAAFDHAGSILASSGGDGKIILWDVKGHNCEPVNQLTGHDDSVLSLHFSSDGRKLLSGSRDHSVRIWDIRPGEANVQMQGHTDRITCACFSPDGRTLLTGSNDRTVRLWDADSGKPVKTVLNAGISVSALQVSPDDNSVWLGGDNGVMEVRDLINYKRIHRIDAHSSRIYALDISAGSQIVVSGAHDGSIKLWRLETFDNIADIAVTGQSVLSLALSNDGSKLVGGLRSGMVILWKIEERAGGAVALKEQCRARPFNSWVDKVIFSKDGNKIEARCGSWGNRYISVLDAVNLAEVNPGDERIQDGAVGSFGRYRLGVGSTELAVKDYDDREEIAWYPKTLEFAVIHPRNRQWAGVMRYNLHHFRLVEE